MAKSYRNLRAKMSPEARAKAKKKAKKMVEEIPLYKLRRAREISQKHLAKLLHVSQAAVSKMERRTDMYVSSLREFIRALGGELEIIAKFPGGKVKTNQFEETNDSNHNPSKFR